jgi:hypothetical protein
MPDFPGCTPPPAQRMPESSKARVRQRLHAAMHGEPAKPQRRWLAPGLAAAAALAVVGGTFVAMSYNRDGGDVGGVGAPLQPADGTSSGAPTPDDPTQPTTSPSLLKPKTAADPARTCDQEIGQSIGPRLPGASVTAQRDSGPGTTYLYETKTAWIVCDDLTASDGGGPTLLSLVNKSRPYQPDTSTLAVSENLITNPDGRWVYEQFVAGGPDFEGVEAISYAFPDGHTEDAVVGENGLWSMTYLASDGVLFDPKVNEVDLDPITVTVRHAGGHVSTFTLAWGLDTCAQINHGC